MSKALQRRLLLAREKLVLSHEEMAKRIEVSVQTLSHWEHGNRTPSGGALDALNAHLEAILQAE
jgi:DNA-binding transcriptional regulator YiaG